MIIRSIIIACVTSFGLFEIAAADLNSGLVAHYKFDGNASDSSGGGNKGKIEGVSLTEDRFGSINSAYNFDIDKYIGVPDNNIWYFSNSDFTINFWMKPSRSISQDFIGQVIDSYNLWKIYLPNNGNTLRFISRGGSGELLFDVHFSEKLVDNWNLVSLVRDKNSFVFYINGKFLDSILSSVVLPNLASTLTFGQSGVFGGDGHYSYQGDLDDIRIYNRALSSSETQELYQDKTSCKVSELGTVTQNLDIHMPSLNYQTLFGTQNIWADLEYKGTNSEGQHIWGLKGFGVNQ